MPNTRARKARSKRNTYKSGGASANIDCDLNPDILDRYLAHSLIVKNYFLPKVYPDVLPATVPPTVSATVVPRIVTKVCFINKGSNGFILRINRGKDDNAVKILFNLVNPLARIDKWIEDTRYKLNNEYTNLMNFADSKFIIKANGYFIFDGLKFICKGEKKFNNITYYLDGEITHEAYKVQPLLSKGSPKIIEPFGGIIMEYVNHSLRGIKAHLNTIRSEKPSGDILFITHRVFNFIELFYQYLLGINDINSKGFIHTDIKIDNLMFNNKDGIYTAKIVDLANIKHIDTGWDYSTNSKIEGLKTQYHTGAIKKMMSLQTKLGLRPATFDLSLRFGNVRPGVADPAPLIAAKKKILVRYDLYSLCVTFHDILNDIRTSLFDFDLALAEALRANPAGIKPKNQEKFDKCLEAFNYFDAKLISIKTNNYTLMDSIFELPDNSELSTMILENCLKKMESKYTP